MTGAFKNWIFSFSADLNGTQPVSNNNNNDNDNNNN